MFKQFLSLLLIAIAACNSTPDQSSSKDSSNAKPYVWTAEEEGEFLSGCVDSAKAQLGDTLAFAKCKCILAQLKRKFPGMDSAAPVLMDVKRSAEFAANCK